ncbi:hypothetical protein TNCV_1240281 [Trichonephila clavipes]|uniref:Uncharacterized protein n=1 Tax=Trichonephila clavipes TaxID=2585209 RepID=A0A8X6WEM1_TRICX|nr:hypothetical protein TNCV_1240281 [Trichonephila clavipes]
MYFDLAMKIGLRKLQRKRGRPRARGMDKEEKWLKDVYMTSNGNELHSLLNQDQETTRLSELVYICHATTLPLRGLTTNRY